MAPPEQREATALVGGEHPASPTPPEALVTPPKAELTPKVSQQTIEVLIKRWVGMLSEVDEEEDDASDWEEEEEDDASNWEEAEEEIDLQEESDEWEDAEEVLLDEEEEDEEEQEYDYYYWSHVVVEQEHNDIEEFFAQTPWNAALAEAERRVRSHPQKCLKDVPVFRIKLSEISDKSFHKLVIRLYRRMRKVRSMSLAGTPVTPPRIAGEEALHIIEIVNDEAKPIETVQCLYKEWSLYFSAFRSYVSGSAADAKWSIFSDEELPSFIEGTQIPYNSSHGKIDENIGAHWWLEIFNKLFKFPLGSKSNVQRALNWNMLLLCEARRIRSQQQKVERTHRDGTIEKIEEEPEIHSWGSLSRTSFNFLLNPKDIAGFQRLLLYKYKVYDEGKKEYAPWQLFGKDGDIAILKYDQDYVVPMLMKLQEAAAEVAESWKPRKKMLTELCSLLDDQVYLGSDQALWWNQMKKYKKRQDFNCYLVYILARKEGISVDQKQTAGLLLKENVRMNFDNICPACIYYVKSELLPCIGAENEAIRSTVGSIIAELFQWTKVAGWMDLFKELYLCIISRDTYRNEGALDILFKMSEDGAEHLDVVVRGLPKRPINVFMPILMKFMKSRHEHLRKLAFGSVSKYAVLLPLPSSLEESMNEYLQQLFNLFNDTSPVVRKMVCSTLVQLVEVHPSRLKPYMKSIIQSILKANQDSDELVALEACQFWCAYRDDNRPSDELNDFLPNLIPMLLDNMILTEYDTSLSDLEEYFDTLCAWNLRKCSAAGLSSICSIFWNDVFPVFMSLIKTKMAKADDIAWKEREAIIASIGAIAEGKITIPNFSQILAFLVPPLDDKCPLVRFSTCRTITVCSKFVIQGLGNPNGNEQFIAFLTGLLHRAGDSSHIVKESAIGALEALEKEIEMNELEDEAICAVQSYIQTKMAETDDIAGKEREAAVALIGAIAEGQIAIPNFSQILAFLIPRLDDKCPLVRFSTCQTMTVCSKFVIQGLGNPNGNEQFIAFVMGLLHRAGDSSDIVKESAMGALDALEKEIELNQLEVEAICVVQSYIQLHGQDKWEQMLSSLDPAAVRRLDRRRDGAWRPHHNEHIYFFTDQTPPPWKKYQQLVH